MSISGHSLLIRTCLLLLNQNNGVQFTLHPIIAILLDIVLKIKLLTTINIPLKTEKF